MDSLFHPFPNYLQMENRFRYRKIRVRQGRARIFLQFEKDEVSSFSSLSTLSTGCKPQAKPVVFSVFMCFTGKSSGDKLVLNKRNEERSAP
ncbi:MAG: hypothetical protein SPE01_08025 [Candidatus Spyradocola sp.]|nr:hypothetical protein [Candidatus Spyradocola sp.]